MLRDVVKLGLVTAVGLSVVATVGVGAGVATLVAGAIFAGVSSAEPPRDDTGISNEGGKPKVGEKKLPKQGKPTSPQEKRPSETTKKQTSQPTTDITLESTSGRSLQSKNSAPNGRDERKVHPPTSTNIESKSDRAPESQNSSPNGRDERKTPTPNRQRSASVLVNKPGVTTTSSKEDAPRVGSSKGTALPDKPSSLSRELEAQIAPEVQHWRNERPLNQETKKRGTATGRGISEKLSSPALAPKAETVLVPEPSASASVNAPGPLPLLPPSPIPEPKSTPHLSEAILESQSKSETTAAVPIKEEKHTPSENGISQDEPSLSTPGDLLSAPLISSKLDMSPPLPAVPVQDSRPEAPISLQATEDQPHPDVSPPSVVPVVPAPVEESADFAADAMLASTLLSMKLETEPLNGSSTPTTTGTNIVAPNGFGVLQGPASASRDSLASVQRRNSKLTSAAKKVSHSVKKVFKGPNDKTIHLDAQRLTSSSSDSVDSQRFSADHEHGLPNGRAFSKLASSSRESLASTKSRRSLMDGTKKGLKRMFRGSDNIEVPPVPPLPSLASTTPEVPISSEKPAVVPSASTPVPKPAKGFLPKSAGQQQAHPSVSNPPQSTRNAPGTPEAGNNNASPLLKGMFKGRANIRVRR